MSQIDIDYSPTNELINTPLIYCQKHKLIYKTKDILRYMTDKEFLKLVLFLSEYKNVFIYSYVFLKDKKERSLIKVSKDILKDLINNESDKYRFLQLYFSLMEIYFIEYIHKSADEYKMYLDYKDIFRKNEIIDIFAPVNVVGYVYLYSIKFANEYIKNYEIIKKSKEFEDFTDALCGYINKNHAENKKA